MNIKTGKKNKTAFSAGEIILLVLTILFLLAGSLIFGWYGLTYIPVYQDSEIHARDLEIVSGSQSCTLVIPAGKLSLRHPSRAAVGSKYQFDAEITLEEPLRFVNCRSGVPNWNISLEAQTALVGSEVRPFSYIRNPAFDQEQFTFHWVFVPDAAVSQYQSHFWLKAIVTQQDQTIENWNILVRDFPMENIALFGQTALFWLLAGGFLLLLGILLLILLLQMRRRKSIQKPS